MTNKFNQLPKEKRIDILKRKFKNLKVGYNQSFDKDDFEDMLALADYELTKIQHLTLRHIDNAYIEVLTNYTKYRRFTVSGFLSSIYEII